MELNNGNRPKAQASDFEGRFREVMSDPSNAFIPRCSDAGSIRDGYVVMHNGLKVTPDYYGDFSRVLSLNRGVHEPQEERMFLEVLKYMPPGATMVELGAYWAFYSMWFQQSVQDATNIMVEANAANLECGRRNFTTNKMTGTFVQSWVGTGGLTIDDLMRDHKIQRIDLLHIDIQGAELEVLQTCGPLFSSQKIGYVFVSTHSQDLHCNCLDVLRTAGVQILASADFDNGTYCYDGIIVGRDARLVGLGPIELDLRN